MKGEAGGESGAGEEERASEGVGRQTAGGGGAGERVGERGHRAGRRGVGPCEAVRG